MSERVENDGYQTPRDAIDPLIPYISFHSGCSVFEPCRGAGNILNAIPVPDKEKDFCEIDTRFSGVPHSLNYLEIDPAEVPADIIITNPPFTQAMEFLEMSLRHGKTVIYLLRLDILGSQVRKDFWNANPPTHLFVLSKRPVFVWVCGGNKKGSGCKSKYPPGWGSPCSNMVAKKSLIGMPEYDGEKVQCGGKVAPATDQSNYGWFVWDRGHRIRTREFLTVL